MQLSTFIKRAGAVGALTISERALAVILGIFLATWLGPARYGAYSLAMAIIVILMIFSEFGVSHLAAREVAAGRADPARGTFAQWIKKGSMIVLVLGALLAAIGIIVVLLFIEIENRELADTISLSFLLLPVLGLLNVAGGVLRGAGRAAAAQIVRQLVPTLATLFVLVAFVLLPSGDLTPQQAMISRLLGSAVSVGFVIWILRREQIFKTQDEALSIKSYSGVLSASFPFMVLNGSTTLLSKSDTLMLGRLTDVATVGIYNVGLQASILVLMVLQVAEMLIGPEFSRMLAAGDTTRVQRFAQGTARLLFAAGAVVSLMLVLFGQFLLQLLFGPEYASSYTPLTILSVGFALGFALGSPGLLLVMAGKERLVVGLVFVAVAVNISLNLLLIPIYGMTGAAIATTVSIVAWKLPSMLFARLRLGIRCSIL